MTGTKQIRLGKVQRYIECLETELRIHQESLNNLTDKNPAKSFFEGQEQQLKKTINELKRWFDLND